MSDAKSYGSLSSIVLVASKSEGEWIAAESKTLERLHYSGLDIALVLPEGEDVSLLPEGTEGTHIVIRWREDEGQSCLTAALREATTRLCSASPSSVSIVLSKALWEKVKDDVATNGWLVFVVCGEGGAADKAPLHSSPIELQCLNELPSALALVNKQRATAEGEKLLAIAYTMKWERERGMLKRKAFPWVPTAQGLVFIPLDLAGPLDRQLAPADAVLHKPTDEIVPLTLPRGAPTASAADRPLAGGQFAFSAKLTTLLQYVQSRTSLRLIDPVENIEPLLDRTSIATALAGLEKARLGIAGGPTVRAPRWVEVANLEEPALSASLASAGVPFPAMVKPRIACGAAESHTMAVVLRQEGFVDLQVPMPATVQEYIDHGSVQFKVYALGPSVFVTPRRSTPNAASLIVAQGANAPAAVVFDSLRSLPTTFEEGDDVVARQVAASGTGCDYPELHRATVEAAASWLRLTLGLTILGFDIVVQEGSGDYVVIDVNYFPTFKDIPNSQAMPAFWSALKEETTK